jgi:hypothetical protein
MVAEIRRAMVGYYPGGGVYAVGNPGITLTKAQEMAARKGLVGFQLLPLGGDDADGGQHTYWRRGEDGKYTEPGSSREFAALLCFYSEKQRGPLCGDSASIGPPICTSRIRTPENPRTERQPETLRKEAMVDDLLEGDSADAPRLRSLPDRSVV